MASLSGNQKLVFLEKVDTFEHPLTPEQSQKMGEAYDLLATRNAELKTAYLKIALRANDPAATHPAAELLGTVGRMKFVRPLFRALAGVDKALALETFRKNRDFYHPICRGLVEKDLGLA